MSDDATLDREFEARLPDASRLAFRVALSVLRDRAEAEDVAQDCLVRAHRAFATLRERERFHGWLVRIAFRLAIDRQRGRRRRLRRETAAEAEPAPRPPSVEDELVRGQLQDRVRAAVDALPEKLRVVTLLAALEGHDVRAVARLLALPEGTVKSRLHLARKALALRLADAV